MPEASSDWSSGTFGRNEYAPFTTDHMRILISLLALIQFSAICLILFGLFLVDIPYQSGESAILYRVEDNNLRAVVESWHQETIFLSKSVTIASGIIIFALSTSVVALVKRQKPPI